MRALLLLLWAAPQVALACGGLFCSAGPGAAPVDQTAERILFEVGDDGRICTTVEIQYTGAPEDFAWVVPVTETPEVSEADAGLLDRLSQVSALTWQYPPALNEGCPEAFFGGGSSGSGCGAMEVEEESADDAGGGDSPGPSVYPNPVNVLDRQQTDRYETVTLAAESAADLVAWLEENAFNVSANMAPAMQPYADDGMVFLAIKLRTDRAARRITPLRFCYTAAAPSIPLRLTAVAAQPQMGIQVFILASTLYAPVSEHGVPDAATLAFDIAGQVNYPAWVARRVAHSDGGFWALERAGSRPDLSYFPRATGAPCESGDDCGPEEACDWGNFDINFTRRCQPRCVQDTFCPEGLACLNWGEGASPYWDDYPTCLPSQVIPELTGDWLTTWYTRMSPEQMTEDPVFVRTPELPAFDGTVDLTGRAPIGQCFEAIEARLPSPCAFVYCGRESTCVEFGDGSAGCSCPGDQVAVAITAPGGLPQAVCAPAQNPQGVTSEDGGDPCSQQDCGIGECVNRGGFATCRCGEGVAMVVEDRVTCLPRPARAEVFAEGAGPDAGNQDDAPAPNRRGGVGALLLVGALFGGFVATRRRSGDRYKTM